MDNTTTTTNNEDIQFVQIENLGHNFKEIYKKLSAPVPEQYLINYIEDGKTFTGYKSQYAINLLNEIMGINGWYTKEEILKEEINSKGMLVSMKITITLETKNDDWCVHVTGYGASFAKRTENAYKGAKTSSFKNACRYLGIGNELYLQSNEDEDITYEEIKEETPKAVDLVEEIKESSSVTKLEEILKKIEMVDGEATKKMLLKMYNDKKLNLCPPKKN